MPSTAKVFAPWWPSAEAQHCLDCGKEPEINLVAPGVWRSAGLGREDEVCREDLSRRLGRHLRKDDFVHVNFLEQSPYLDDSPNDDTLNALVDKYFDVGS